VSIGCFEQDQVVAIVEVHDELLEGGIAEDAMNSVGSSEVNRVHRCGRESKARKVNDGCASLGVFHLAGEAGVDDGGGRAGVDGEECGLLAVDDGGHDDLRPFAIDAGPGLHGWRFEAVEAAEVVCRIATESVERRGWR